MSNITWYAIGTIFWGVWILRNMNYVHLKFTEKKLLFILTKVYILSPNWITMPCNFIKYCWKNLIISHHKIHERESLDGEGKFLLTKSLSRGVFREKTNIKFLTLFINHSHINFSSIKIRRISSHWRVRKINTRAAAFR